MLANRSKLTIIGAIMIIIQLISIISVSFPLPDYIPGMTILCKTATSSTICPLTLNPI